MNIEEAIFSRLSDSGSETYALAGNRIYPQNLPQNPTYPAVTYRRVSTLQLMAHDGTLDIVFSRFQFDCYGKSFRQPKDLANALRTELNGFKGVLGGAGGVTVHGIFFLNEVDDFGSVAVVWRVAVDFKIIHKE